ncbi:MAG: type II toxin-antitoxin system RelE/ParE family toxin [Sedimentisphaerales bacterium]|nr:type II toxin-antitoxin system RelE/ParE family toxin [Sedimentisphaerales bacterium]
MYTIELKSQPQKFIRDIPKNLQTQVLDKMETLKKDATPANSEQLHSNPELRRIRSGQYRIIYHIDYRCNHIIVTKIGHQKDVYR